MRKHGRNRVITDDLLKKYKRNLIEDEKSRNTVDQYLRGVKQFQEFANGKKIDKYLVIRYKDMMIEKYKERSVNAKLSARNSFFK